MPHMIDTVIQLFQPLFCSFHIGSGCNDSGPYVEMIQEAGNAFRMAENKGFRLQLLDIGGGFFGDYNGEEYLKEVSTSHTH